MNEIRIPYKPNKVIFTLVIVLFGACAGFTGNVAITNDRGLTLNRIIEFSPLGASIFYWVIAIAALVFVLLGFFALAKSIFSKREIVITNDSIRSPKSGFSKQDVTVHLSDITGIHIQTIQKTRILNIEHSAGTLSIPNSMLPNKALFEELISQLEAKVNT